MYINYKTNAVLYLGAKTDVCFIDGIMLSAVVIRAPDYGGFDANVSSGGMHLYIIYMASTTVDVLMIEI